MTSNEIILISLNFIHHCWREVNSVQHIPLRLLWAKKDAREDMSSHFNCNADQVPSLQLCSLKHKYYQGHPKGLKTFLK